MEIYRSDFSAVDVELGKLERLQNSQKAKRQRTTSPYITNTAQQFFGTIKRSYQRVKGDKVYLGAIIFSATFMSLITGSVFVNTPSDTSGFFSKGGVIFFSVLFNALQAMSEVATQYSQRPIVQKHKGFAFYHPFVDSLSSLTADLPLKFINTLIFDIVMYFMVGLKNEAGPFFIFVLVTYLAALVMSAIFRTVAAATKQPEIASGIAGILVLILPIYTGYVIPVPSMHPWFAWLRFVNPISYGFEALMVNEFHDQSGLCAMFRVGHSANCGFAPQCKIQSSNCSLIWKHYTKGSSHYTTLRLYYLNRSLNHSLDSLHVILLHQLRLNTNNFF